MQQEKKYVPFNRVSLPDRQWPDKIITKAPIWCSVDLRDGNQALVTPMGIDEKLKFFHTLVDVGFKEIEVGFPSASETEYEILQLECRSKRDYGQKVNRASSRHFFELLLFSKNHLLKSFLSDFF